MTGTMYVDLAAGPDDRDRFRVMQYGQQSYLTLDQIKAAVARGDDLCETGTPGR